MKKTQQNLVLCTQSQKSNNFQKETHFTDPFLITRLILNITTTVPRFLPGSDMHDTGNKTEMKAFLVEKALHSFSHIYDPWRPLIPWSKNSFTILVIQFVLAQVTDKEVSSAAVSNTSMYRAKKAIATAWKLL